MGCCPGPLRCTFNAAKAGFEVCDGRRISALEISWRLRDRARQIRVKPLRVQTGWPGTPCGATRAVATGFAALAGALRLAATRGDAVCAVELIVCAVALWKISRNRRGHERMPKMQIDSFLVSDH